MEKNSECLKVRKYFSQLKKSFWVGGALWGLPLGLKDECDLTFDAKEHTTKDDVISARLGFFFDVELRTG